VGLGAEIAPETEFGVRRPDGVFSRLCRLMCGKALPYRVVENDGLEATPPKTRPGLQTRIPSFRKGRAFSAHQAAKPLSQTVPSKPTRSRPARRRHPGSAPI